MGSCYGPVVVNDGPCDAVLVVVSINTSMGPRAWMGPKGTKGQTRPVPPMNRSTRKGSQAHGLRPHALHILSVPTRLPVSASLTLCLRFSSAGEGCSRSCMMVQMKRLRPIVLGGKRMGRGYEGLWFVDEGVMCACARVIVLLLLAARAAARFLPASPEARCQRPTPPDQHHPNQSAKPDRWLPWPAPPQFPCRCRMLLACSPPARLCWVD